MWLFWYFGVLLTGTVFIGCVAQMIEVLLFQPDTVNPTAMFSQAIALLTMGAFTASGLRKARAARWQRIRQKAACKSAGLP